MSEDLEGNFDMEDEAAKLLEGFRIRFTLHSLGPASPCSTDPFLTNLAYQRIKPLYNSNS